MAPHDLIGSERSVLVVVDTQDGFIGKLEPERRRPFLSRVDHGRRRRRRPRPRRPHRLGDRRLRPSLGDRTARGRLAGRRDQGCRSVARRGPEFGLERLRQLGIELVSTKGVFYEWLRTVEAAEAFGREHPDVSPPGDLVL